MTDELASPAPGGADSAGCLTLRTDLLGDLVVPGSVARAAELQDLAARAAEHASRARGDGTRRVYRSA